MNIDTLCNYFEEYNLNNDTIFLICFMILSFVIMANTYFLTIYLYKKYCKNCCKCCKNDIPLYIESRDPSTNEFYVISEPLV